MSVSKKPREWWVNEASTGRSMNGRYKLYTACDKRPQSPGWIELVERQAYDQLRAELEQAKGETDERFRLECEEWKRLAEERKGAAEQAKAESAALKADADALAGAFEALVSHCKWYAETWGLAHQIPQELHHFLAVEAEGNFAEPKLTAYREKWGK